MTTFDFCVVGKGLIGSATARHLARSGASVVLVGPDEPLDKATHRGVFGSHYDEGRITRILDPDPVWARLAAASIARYHDIEAESDLTFYTEAGFLLLAPDTVVGRDHLARVADIGAALDVEYERLGAEVLGRRFPALGFREPTTALFQKRLAGHVSGRKLVEAQSQASIRHGGTVIRDAVASVSEHPDVLAVQTTSGDTIRAETVVVAAGAFSNFGGLLPKRVLWRVEGRVVVLFELDAPLREKLSLLPAVIWKRDPTSQAKSFYALPPIRYPDGCWYLKVGGGAWNHRLDTFQQTEEWFRSAAPREDIDHLRSNAIELIPALKGAPSAVLRCVITHTATGYPYIARMSDRIVIGAGGNGAAAKSSDEIGRLAAIVASGVPWPREYDAAHFTAVLTDA